MNDSSSEEEELKIAQDDSSCEENQVSENEVSHPKHVGSKKFSFSLWLIGAIMLVISEFSSLDIFSLKVRIKFIEIGYHQ